MSAHTPGPYYVAKTDGHQGLIISEATGENIAVVYDKKDAPLLAAAPELLASLQAILRAADHAGDKSVPVGHLFDWQEARAALAKAISV